MRLIEAILHRSAVALPEGDNNPLDTFLQIVNFGLERTLGKDGFRKLEPKRFIQTLRNPACGELDEATRKRLDKKGITSSFWDRILVFSSHEECFLPGQLSFVYDKNKRLFVLSLGNVLMNAQDIQILCHSLERFYGQRIQTKFIVQQDRKKSIPTLNMKVGIDQINKREGILFIIARYRDGHPQISLSVLNLDSDWKELFDDTGKLKAAQSDIIPNTTQGLNVQELTLLRQEELPPPLIAAINNALRASGLIKPDQQIQSNGIFLPRVNYAPHTPQVPLYIVARQEEVNPASTISVAKEGDDSSNLKVDLNGLFVRCPKESVTVVYPPEGNTAILLTLNPRAWMGTDRTKPSEGFYRKEKGIIAIPFELPKDLKD